MAIPPLELYILTFNCARIPIYPDSFSDHVFDALSNHNALPTILVLSLQELAPLAFSFLGGSYLTPYLAPFQKAVEYAAAKQEGKYKNVATKYTGMTAVMVFVLEEAVEKIQWLETAGVGTGFWEMGNKGAAAVRLGYVPDGQEEELELTFVAAHLAPAEDMLERRNQDWESIARGLVFEPYSTTSRETASAESEESPLLNSDESLRRTETGDSGIYQTRSWTFVAGDLNYRTSSTSPGPDTYKEFPQPTKDSEGNLHYSSLLPHDQLSAEMKAGRTFQGFSEASIDFPPTYKYSSEQKPLTADEDLEEYKWASHRWPSWCDRILWLPPAGAAKGEDGASHSVTVKKYTALPVMPTSDHRPVALSFSIPASIGPSSSDDDRSTMPMIKAPFGIDPSWKTRRAAARTREIVLGVLAYLSWTWEGEGLLLATIVGGAGGIAVIRALLGDV